MYGPTPKRHITYIQTAPAVAHLWSADLRERRKLNAEIARMKRDSEEYMARRERETDYRQLCHSIVMCRTKHGKVGVEYPVLKARLQDWVANYPTTQSEWTGIQMTVFRNSLSHLDYYHDPYQP